MKSSKFCPLCGKTGGIFIKGFCRQCFLRERELLSVPAKIELPFCRECGKARVFGKQAALDSGQLPLAIKQKARARELAEATVSVELKPFREGKATAIVRAKGFVDSAPLMLEKEVSVALLPQQCDACMRLKSNYWEAKVQLRGSEKKKVQKALKLLQGILAGQRKKDSLSAIAAVEETKNGLDVLIGSSKAAGSAVRQLQREFNAETKRSFKLVGVDKTGREKKRFTFSVRL